MPQHVLCNQLRCAWDPLPLMSANQREAVTGNAGAFQQKRTPVRTGAEYAPCQPRVLPIPQASSTTACSAGFVANLRGPRVETVASMYLDGLGFFGLVISLSTDLSTGLSTSRDPHLGRA